MSKQINVEEIIMKKLYEHTRQNFIKEERGDESCKTANWWYLNKDTDSYTGLKAAIKEIVEAVIDECAENAKLEYKYRGLKEEGETAGIDKKSILNVRNMVKYE